MDSINLTINNKQKHNWGANCQFKYSALPIIACYWFHETMSMTHNNLSNTWKNNTRNKMIWSYSNHKYTKNSTYNKSVPIFIFWVSSIEPCCHQHHWENSIVFWVWLIWNDKQRKELLWHSNLHLGFLDYEQLELQLEILDDGMK